MKKLAIFFGMISLLSLSLTLQTFSQPAKKADRDIPISQRSAQSVPQSIAPTYSGILLSTETILGSNLRDPQGENVGEIKHLMINPETGSVSYAVVSVGGFLGMGEKTIIVPWHALEVARDGRSIVLNASEQLLRDAPEYREGPQTERAERSRRDVETAAQQGQVYNPEKEQTIYGKVVSVNTGAPMEGMPAGLHMLVKTDATTTSWVYLGPEWYMERQGMTFRDNADVQVTGVVTPMGDQSILMARTVEVEGQSLTLRDEQGKPLWSSDHGKGSQQSGETSRQR